MGKTLTALFLILLVAISLGGTFAYADKDENEIKLNQALRIDDDSKVFEISGEGKSKTQWSIKNNHQGNDSEFMIKGVISVVSLNTITIDGKVINIDSSVTDEIKITGKLEVGAYAMAKGIVKDSNFYAEKIVVNQRNKKDIKEENEDEDEIASPSATPAPTVTVNDDEDENATMTAQLDFGNIINAIQNFLNYLKELASKI